MSYRSAICSHSLGRAWVHQLPAKFTAASQVGISGIEIFFEDLLYLASSFPGGPTPSNQRLAAQQIRHLADSLSLVIIGIGPFSDYEGNLSPSAQAKKLEELKLWFDIARILGTDLIQIPCTFQTEADGFTGDFDTVVRDLRQIADLGARGGFRFAHENLCFGTWNNTWSKVWAVVKAVDRENFGLCLDTFNIAGREYADPKRADGKVENAETVFRESMRRMVKEIDVKKVFYVQIVDAERLASPLVEGHEFFVKGQQSRMSWSRNCRLFMCEEERGGYLPVIEVLKAICDEKEGLGYKGWLSVELFNRSLIDEREEVPMEHAERAVASWKKIVRAMKWEGEAEQIISARKNTTPLKQIEMEISARL